MRPKIIQTFTIALALLTGFSVMAQNPGYETQQPQETEVSDQDLKKFAEVSQEVNKVQTEFRTQMVDAVKSNGLEVQEFNQIAQAQQDPNADADVSDEEVQKFESAAQKVQTLQQDMQQQVETAVEQAGMDMNRYNQLSLAVNQDPELRQKMEQMKQAE